MNILINKYHSNEPKGSLETYVYLLNAHIQLADGIDANVNKMWINQNRTCYSGFDILILRKILKSFYLWITFYTLFQFWVLLELYMLFGAQIGFQGKTQAMKRWSKLQGTSTMEQWLS